MVPSRPDAASSPRSLYRDAMQAAGIGLVINLLLGAVKLAGGIAWNSFALISDAVNSLGDSLISATTLAALWYAQRPADEEHPYGHTRAETVAAAYASILILGSAIWVGWEAAGRFWQHHEPPPVWSLWIAGINVVIKEILYRYKCAVAKRTGSTAIFANAWDHRSDALCSLAVLVGLGIVRWGGPLYIWADEAAAIVVVLMILYTGGQLLRQSTSELLDPQASEDIVDEVRRLASAVEGVIEVEKLWVRKTGIEYLIDIHIQVEPKLTVEAGHLIGHAVKDRLVQNIAAVRDVLVHLEPFSSRSDG